MNWEIEYTDEFEAWWASLNEAEQDAVAASVGQIERLGPSLGFPYSSGMVTSKHDHLRELRVQHKGQPYRVLYAFDPRRTAILLIGGKKTGDDRWYETFVPLADKLYDQHLELLKKEGLL
ncbi:MAG: type II toxin-antitoxin system RelE/ParE family toxin [Candidatus Competibacter sp.]|nr:type II toxin-antitoxin system RelE/ParE family toxin [Candidatus Competibacter sp.]